MNTATDALYVGRLVLYEVEVQGRMGDYDPVRSWFRDRENTLPEPFDLTAFAPSDRPKRIWTHGESPPDRFVYVFGHGPMRPLVNVCHENGHRTHDGFRGWAEWGYGGHGPADLAFTLILDTTRNVELARFAWGRMDREITSRLHRDDDWALRRSDIAALVSSWDR